MNRTIKISLDEYYHIYNRGTDKRPIFLDSNDYNRFVLMMSYCNGQSGINIRNLKRIYRDDKLPFTLPGNGEKLVYIGAWCLMPNHFHLLLKERVEGGIVKFLSKLTTGYSKYFNKRYERDGSLFQGTYKAEHANTDNYLKYLYSYINLNPVKLFEPDWKLNGITDVDRALKFLKSYEYSSFFDYWSGVEREWGNLLNKEAFPQYFTNQESFSKEILDWLELDPAKFFVDLNKKH